MRTLRRTKTQVLKAVAGSLGIFETICLKLAIDRKTLYNYRKRWKEVDEAINDEREKGLDFAESKLMKLIQNEDFRAISFYLERKGADRGWGDSRKLDVTSGGAQLPPVVIKFADDE